MNYPTYVIKTWKKFRPEQDSDIGSVIYRLSYQAIWEVIVLWIPYIPAGEQITILKGITK